MLFRPRFECLRKTGTVFVFLHMEKRRLKYVEKWPFFVLPQRHRLKKMGPFLKDGCKYGVFDSHLLQRMVV